MTPTIARSQQLQSQCLFNCSKHGAQRERLNGHLRRGMMVRIIVPHLQFQRVGPPIPHRVFWCHSFRRASRSSVHPGPYDSNTSKKPAVAVAVFVELQQAWDAKRKAEWTLTTWHDGEDHSTPLAVSAEYSGAIRSGVLPGLVCIPVHMTPTLARSQQLQSQCLFNCSKHGTQRARLNGHVRCGMMVRIIVPHLQFQRVGPPIPHRVFWCHSFRRASRSSVHPGPYDSNTSKKPAVAVAVFV